jgi:perosamine synthetase
MKKINLNFPVISDEEIDAVSSVLRSGMLAQGTKVSEFEEQFLKISESKFSVAVNSGTSALHAGLLASGIGPGDEVIVPSFTFAATANAVALTGATPVFADIELEDFCISVDHAESLITEKTAGIIAVHLFGHPANLIALKNLTEKKGIKLFEDAAQAHLAEYFGIRVGSLSEFTAFSFYPTKNITAGEGGMISTNSESIYRKSRLLRNQGMEERYVHEIVGYNYRMTEIHAAIGLVQLKRLSEWTEKRISNAEYLTSNLTGVITPHLLSGIKHVFHQYVIRVDGADRQRLRVALSNKGISTDIYYPRPVHSQPAYKLNLDLPKTFQACEEVLAIPVHSQLSDDELERIVITINQNI